MRVEVTFDIDGVVHIDKYRAKRIMWTMRPDGLTTITMHDEKGRFTGSATYQRVWRIRRGRGST